MENTTELLTTPTPEVTPEATVKTPDTNAYQVDTESRTVAVEYPEHKFQLEHEFKHPEKRELIHFFLNAPQVKAVQEGETRLLGSPEQPSAELHDKTCKALRRLSMKGDEQKKYSLEQIRELAQKAKAEAVATYLFAYYEVELKSPTGDMDDILFGRESEIEATVKVRPGGKVEKTFKVLLSRPNDLEFSRFTQGSQGSSIIDPKRDTLLMEFLGDEALAEMTGGEDEGDRVMFQKTTQFVRSFFEIFDKNFSGAENVIFEGEAYNPQKRNQFLAALDPVLKFQIAFALRNFM